MSKGRWDIPRTWSWAQANDISNIVGGGTPSTRDSSNFSDKEIPWITPADLTGYKDVYISRGARDLSEKGYNASGAQLMPAGTVLFSSRAPIGYCVIAANEVATNQGFKSLILKDEIVPEYIRYYLISSKEYAESLASGTTFKELSGKRVAEIEIPIPPIAEQKRIVKKLDELTNRTSRAQKDLNAIPALIAQYKDAILTAAFSGDLTHEWRIQNSASQTAEKNLENVRKNRKKNRKLAQRKVLNKSPQIGLPKSWAWISPDEIADDEAYSIGIGPFGSNLVRADYREKGTRLIFVRDIRRESFSQEDARYITSQKAKELHQHVVSGGEVLITKMGEPPGDTALYPEGLGIAVITADCIKLKPDRRLAIAPFLVFCIRSALVREQIKEITMGVAQQKVSLDRFRRIALPIPPIEEQNQIVRRIESAFAWLDNITSEHKNSSKLLSNLEQAILSAAFRGELVPQDPNDEPAMTLLNRIKSNQEKFPKTKRKTKKSSFNKLPKKHKKESVVPTSQKEDASNLIEIVKTEGPLSPEELLAKSNFNVETIEDFYESLKRAVESKKIIEDRPDSKTVLLKTGTK